MDLEHPTADLRNDARGRPVSTDSSEPNQAEMRALRAEAISLLVSYCPVDGAAHLQPILERLQRMCLRDARAAGTHRPQDSPAPGRPAPPVNDLPGNGSFPPLSRIAKDYIIRVYQAAGCNKTRAARMLEIDVKTLYNKLKRYGLR